MSARACRCCGELFQPSRFHPDQQYCTKAACRRSRRARWQRAKLRSDSDYRANQAAAQARWRANNGDYWRTYRSMHPAYVDRNRRLTGQRRKASGVLQGKGDGAKMDVAPAQPVVAAGRYRLEPVGEGGVAKMDVAIVQLTVLETVTEDRYALQREDLAPDAVFGGTFIEGGARLINQGGDG